MSDSTEAVSRKPMRRTIRGGRPYFFGDPAIDKVLNMVVVLGSEVWTLRERLAALEAIQIRQGGLAAGEVDAHEFSAQDEAKLAAQRKEFIDSLFRILQEQVEESRRRVAKATPRVSSAVTSKVTSKKKPPVARRTPRRRSRSR